jgi:hypothetical protein
MMGKSMPCISLWQPWASLVAGRLKQYETRSWCAPKNLWGGLLAIHAAKRWTGEERAYTERFIRQYPETAAALRPDDYQNPPLGAIVCVCRLLAVYASDKHIVQVGISDRERAFGDWSSGRFVWKLEVVKVPPAPIPYAGKQGIFQCEYELTQPDT